MGSESSHLSRLNPGRFLAGRYRIIGELSQGGFSQTFLAEDLHLPGRPHCVVKQLKPKSDDTRILQTSRRLFETEAKVLEKLGLHDQIPSLLAYFEEDREFYLVLELIKGESLAQELGTGQIWPEMEVIKFLQDILSVLKFVHQQNVIHRDIKPSNLIRRFQDGKIVLIDFGAVKQTTSQLADPESNPTVTITIGTQGYMPNEQLAGHPRFSSDVYAVGMLGIQALTGIKPRDLGQNLQTGEVNWHRYGANVNPELVIILDRMVRYHFRDRYPTATEALQTLNDLFDYLNKESKAVIAQAGEPQILSPPSPPLALPEEAPSSLSANKSFEELGEEAEATPAPITSLYPSPTSEELGEEAEATPAPITSLYPSPASEELGEEAEATPAPITSLYPSPASKEAFTSPASDELTSLNYPKIGGEEAVEDLNSASQPSLSPEEMANDRFPEETHLVSYFANEPLPENNTDLLSHSLPSWSSLEQAPSSPSSPWPLSLPTIVRSVPRKLALGVGVLAVASIAILPTLINAMAPPIDVNSRLVALPCQEPSPPSLLSRDPNYKHPDGSLYYGSITEAGSLADGRVIIIFPDGAHRYDGELLDGKRNGCGTLTFGQGRRYQGQFRNDHFHGQGVWTLANGDRYIGAFRNGKCQGRGVFIFADGGSRRGIWWNGRLVGSNLTCD